MIPKGLGMPQAAELVEVMRARGYSKALNRRAVLRNWLRVLERTWS